MRPAGAQQEENTAVTRARWHEWVALAALSLPLAACRGLGPAGGWVQEPQTCSVTYAAEVTPDAAPVPPAPGPECGDWALPINLPTALRLAHASPLDVALAAERVRLATAALQRARVLWLPSLQVGVDYFRHDGQIQDTIGNVFGTSRSALLLGAAPNLVFSTSDALFAPLAERQVVAAREAA